MQRHGGVAIVALLRVPDATGYDHLLFLLGFRRHACGSNVAIMAAGFVLMGCQLAGYFITAT